MQTREIYYTINTRVVVAAVVVVEAVVVVAAVVVVEAVLVVAAVVEVAVAAVVVALASRCSCRSSPEKTRIPYSLSVNLLL